MTSEHFDPFFRKATGQAPFPFQRRFAEALPLPQLVHVPTGLGKTAMAVLGWLWRRTGANEELRAATPRRLVYCLPMRVLVEQTRDCAILWLQDLGLLGGTADFEEKDGEKDGRKTLKSYTPDWGDPARVTVHVLMGGEDQDDWDLHPERDAILVGTQDMLLSRALNRGYAASRARWPMQFGLLHTDCLWVFDEIQLMGAGLATTAQLEAFRRLLPSRESLPAKEGHGCRSVWMSATMQKDWLKTVDFGTFLESAPELTFEWEKETKAEGLDERTRQTLRDRWNAPKPLAKAGATIGDPNKLAAEVLETHRNACAAAGKGTRTVVVVNTVRRACEVFEALTEAVEGSLKKGAKGREASGLPNDAGSPVASKPGMVLLHSRFRSADRERQVQKALAKIEPGGPGLIVISTQVVEAGVDLSATTLFTELAPWSSLVQRFGRCNRRGEDNGARVFWIDLPGDKVDVERMALPYELEALDASRKLLKELTDAGLTNLHPVKMDFEHTHVIRRKDLIDLFDTTPDLAGNDIDIDRFVREVEDSDVHVFWRAWDRPTGYESPPDDGPAPRRGELCPAPIGTDANPGFRQFIKKHGGMVFRWDFLDKRWQKVAAAAIAPGQVFLAHTDAGGYSAERGWDPDSRSRVAPVDTQEAAKGKTPDATEDERLSRIDIWQTVAEHADDTCREMDSLLVALPLTPGETDALRHATRWHDRGKAHGVFQNAINDGRQVAEPEAAPRQTRPAAWSGCRFVAKAPGKRWEDGRVVDPGFWRRYERKHFRHELASALAVLDPRNDKVPDEVRDLVAYLVAAHHGKVRLSIRSLPNEKRPGGRRFARGIWDEDILEETNLGDGVIAPRVTLSLEPMELGLCEQPPFAGRPSWVERMIGRRDLLGPFRLAYLEAILRAADMRASRPPTRRPDIGSEPA